jgi:tetratricopeptide (TPR) repeat protein
MTDLQNDSTIAFVGQRYRILGRLGEGGMGIVYRAYDRLSGETVALKRVLTHTQNLQFATLPADNQNIELALAGEFKILATLRHPNIISVLDYGFERLEEGRTQPYYTMTLLENPRDVDVVAKERDTRGKIQLMIDILQALRYLHRRNIIHRDLKPSNVLVGEDGRAKVLDFGLATDDASNETAPSGVAGTIAYMSPEMLTNGEATRASDLYALGVMSYEFFAGHHPFVAEHPGLLIGNILKKDPDLSIVPEQVQDIIGNLLQKSATERYTNAKDVIAELYKALGETIPRDDDRVRESFLQAATLVGRKSELATLTTSLAQTNANNSGSLWLVAGESGVGKTRLVEEFQIRALVDGMRVIRAQAQPQNQLAIISDIVRSLALYVQINDAQAQLLSKYAPDLGKILERNLAPPTERETSDTVLEKQRYEVILELVKQLSNTPTLLILEDLHWAESILPLLNNIAQNTKAQALMMVGTYRSDERPYLYGSFKRAEQLLLESLKPLEIEELSAAMLGEGGRRPQIQLMLQRETDGNAFFIVEVIRALADVTGGDLAQVGLKTLPRDVFATGVKRIVERRLARIPLDSQPMLRFAAVLGRRIDFKLLAWLDSEFDLPEWLALCSDAAVLGVEEGYWQFPHVKLRESILEALADDERPRLHRYAAQAIEEVYPNNLSYARELTEHWMLAGNALKEGHWAEIVAQQVAFGSDYRQAWMYYERASRLLPPDSPRQLLLRVRIAEMRYRQGDIVRAVRLLTGLTEVAEGAMLLDVLGLLGEIHTTLFHYDKAEQYLQRALELLPTTPTPITILSQIHYAYGLLRLRMDRFTEAEESFNKALKTVFDTKYTVPQLKAFNMQGTLIEQNSGVEAAMQHYERVQSAAMQLGNTESAVRAMNSIAILHTRQGDFESAKFIFQMALELAQQVNNNEYIGVIQINHGFCHIQLGDIDNGAQLLSQGLTLIRQNGDVFRQLQGLLYYAHLFHKRNESLRSIGLIGILLNHPASIASLKTAAQALAEQLDLTETVRAAGLVEGARVRLDEALNALMIGITYDW